MDGPATQYRQKANYFYLSSEPYIWRSPVLVLKLGMGWGTDGGGGLKRSGQVVEKGEVTPDGLKRSGQVAEQGEDTPDGLKRSGQVVEQGEDTPDGLKRSGQVVEQGEVTPDGQRLNEKLNKGSFSISQRMLLNEGLR